jgi:dTMP kinase
MHNAIVALQLLKKKSAYYESRAKKLRPSRRFSSVTDAEYRDDGGTRLLCYHCLVRHGAKGGRFITFEGLDGCGKSTHQEMLAEVLREQGLDVLATREPGGTAMGERVRGILLDSRTQGLAPLAELALMFASRAQHIAEVILPAMNRGTWVLCDRYTDSSEAYQGAGRQLGVEAVLTLHRVLCLGLQPNLTLLLDNDVAASLARARRRNLAAEDDENRFEQENRAFYERVHQQFLAIAQREPERVVVIDARRPLEAVHKEVVAAVRRRLPAGQG